MPINIAETAGFCFGVNRAVNMVYDLLNKNEKVCTLGPIIHNTQMVTELEEKGCVAIENVVDCNPECTLVIRSHGVGNHVMDEINRLGLKCVDATCPFVKKIHNIVKKAGNDNQIVLIAGNKNHPEIIGIIGHCTGECYTFKNNEDGNFQVMCFMPH